MEKVEKAERTARAGVVVVDVVRKGKAVDLDISGPESRHAYHCAV